MPPAESPAIKIFFTGSRHSLPCLRRNESPLSSHELALETWPALKAGNQRWRRHTHPQQFADWHLLPRT